MPNYLAQLNITTTTIKFTFTLKDKSMYAAIIFVRHKPLRKTACDNDEISTFKILDILEQLLEKAYASTKNIKY